jgi:hypothetical protein
MAGALLHALQILDTAVTFDLPAHNSSAGQIESKQSKLHHHVWQK